MPKKMNSKRPELVILAEHVWFQSGGNSFRLDGLNLKDLGAAKDSELKSVLGALIGAGYLVCDFKVKIYSWTPQAKAIKALKITFVDQQPGHSVKGVGPKNVAAVIAGAASAGPEPVSPATKGTKAGESPPPKRKYVRKPFAPESETPSPESFVVTTPVTIPIPETPPALDNFGKPLMTAPPPVAEATPGAAGLPIALETCCGPVDLFLPRGEAVVRDILANSLPLLFLTPDESAALVLLGEAPKPLRLSWLIDVGLGDGDGLAHFLQKLSGLGIIAQIPDQVGEQDTAFFLDTVKYPCYLQSHTILNPEAVTKELRRQQEDLARVQAEREAHREGMKETLKLAREVVALRTMELEEAQRQLQQAEEDRDQVSGDLAILEGEIEGANFPSRIQSLKDKEEVVGQASLLNSLELHELMTLFLAREEGEEAE